MIENLSLLTLSPYNHRYFVDGEITVADWYDGTWHTAAVGGLGAGGQGFYALDLTTAPAFLSITEDNIKSKVSWEFGDADDANLGYSYSRPAVARLPANLASGQKWAVIIGNGYVNSDNDGAVGDGQARLIAIDIKTGLKVGEIIAADATDSIANPNGLSSPAVVDINGDGHADTAYAGDI